MKDKQPYHYKQTYFLFKFTFNYDNYINIMFFSVVEVCLIFNFLCSILLTIICVVVHFCWLLYCLSFYELRLLITPFISSNFSSHIKSHQVYLATWGDLSHNFSCNWFVLIWFLVFNATFSNISAISWRPVLVVEEAGVPGENHRPWTSNW